MPIITNETIKPEHDDYDYRYDQAEREAIIAEGAPSRSEDEQNEVLLDCLARHIMAISRTKGKGAATAVVKRMASSNGGGGAWVASMRKRAVRLAKTHSVGR